MCDITSEQLAFAVFCVENVAERLDISGDKVYKLLTEESNILNDYIFPCYDVLHTQSKEYIIDDIIDYMRESGVIQ